MSHSNVIFDANTGMKVPDTDSILKNVENDWKNALGQNLNTDPSSPQGQLITSQSAIIAANKAELVRLATQFNPLTAQGVWQDAIGYIYFLRRKTAQPTVVTCTCKGFYNTVIPANAVVESSNGYRFTSVGEVVIPQEETIDVQFICTTAGVIPVKANTVNKIITVVSGWDSVNNSSDGITGTLIETQAEFERRRYASVAKNAHGTVASLYGEIASLDNVVSLVILENRGNIPKVEAGVTIEGHSIYISVFGGTDADIAKAIYHKLDAGCGTTGSTSITYIAEDYFNAEYAYNITRPTQIPFYIRVKIKLTNGTPADIVEQIKLSLTNNFNGIDSNDSERVQMAQAVYASRFYEPVINAGTKELVEVVISLDNANFSDYLFINADKYPILSYETIDVITEEV